MPAVYSATTQTGPFGKESTKQNVTWEQRITIVFSNKPITLKNTNNWKPNKVRSAVNLSGNFAICWLVSFDPKFFTLFNGVVLVVEKWVFRLKVSSEICDYDISPSRTESLGVYITQRWWQHLCIHAKQTVITWRHEKATSALFSIYVLIG